jgi:hypothetical protein
MRLEHGVAGMSACALCGAQAGLPIKNPPKKTHPKKLTQKNPPKKPTQKNPPKKTSKNVFFGFFNFLIFYENNTNFSL